MSEPVDPIALTRALLAVPSPSDHEQPAVAIVHTFLAERGWTVVTQQVTPFRANIYAHRGHPVVVFSTHLDTVPPELPFREDDTTIHGRGACDAKGIAAAMIAAAHQLIDAGETRIGLLFVVGEETTSDGAIAAARLEPRGRFLVNGEPTGNRLTIAQKGTRGYRLEAAGRAAHSGYPELGDSAIDHLLDALQRIRQLPLPVDPILGPSTLNIGLIQGGKAANVVAPSATASLLLRTVGPTGEIDRAIVAAAGPRVQVTVIDRLPPATAPALPGWQTAIAAFASDMAIHGAWGTCYQLGPGSIHVAHTDHERIDKAELLAGVALYVKLARELLAQP